MNHPPLPKDEARHLAYRGLRNAQAARFPFPIEGRIPNFVGAEAAAKNLSQLSVYQHARTIKVNPDAPQLPVRAMALKDGKTIIMPSPRLRGSFIVVDPSNVPHGKERRAASLSHCAEYGQEISISELSERLHAIDLVVAGSVAVTHLGARAGKGEGYADMEYAIMRELGHPEIPVVTTVHPAQIVPHLANDAHDLSLDYIVTPDEVIVTGTPYPKPTKIDWELLSDEDLAAMPVLIELRQLRWHDLTTPDIVAPGLRLLFVGINPGKASASHGHNFAGPGNHFWRLLHESGLTPHLFAPQHESLLLDLGIGITNVVSRASHGEADLSWEELEAGGAQLRDQIKQLRPGVVALLGKNVYRAYAEKSRSARVEWGAQSGETVAGVREFVAPNPSARSTIPYDVRLQYFTQLCKLMDR